MDSNHAYASPDNLLRLKQFGKLSTSGSASSKPKAMQFNNDLLRNVFLKSQDILKDKTRVQSSSKQITANNILFQHQPASQTNLFYKLLIGNKNKRSFINVQPRWKEEEVNQRNIARAMFQPQTIKNQEQIQRQIQYSSLSKLTQHKKSSSEVPIQKSDLYKNIHTLSSSIVNTRPQSSSLCDQLFSSRALSHLMSAQQGGNQGKFRQKQVSGAKKLSLQEMESLIQRNKNLFQAFCLTQPSEKIQNFSGEQFSTRNDPNFRKLQDFREASSTIARSPQRVLPKLQKKKRILFVSKQVSTGLDENKTKNNFHQSIDNRSRFHQQNAQKNNIKIVFVDQKETSQELLESSQDRAIQNQINCFLEYKNKKLGKFKSACNPSSLKDSINFTIDPFEYSKFINPNSRVPVTLESSTHEESFDGQEIYYGLGNRITAPTLQLLQDQRTLQ